MPAFSRFSAQCSQKRHRPKPVMAPRTGLLQGVNASFTIVLLNIEMGFNLNLIPFVPHRALAHRHAQTLLGHLLSSPALRGLGMRHELVLADADRIVVRVLEGKSDAVIYLFHGLAGSADSGYMRRLANLAQERNHSVVLVNHRGCGEGRGLALHPYHSGKAEDLSAVFEFGRNHFRHHRHLAVGFSLSGNALLLLLSGARGTTKPDFAISVNAPIHLDRASRLLGQGFNRVYTLRFIHDLKREIAAKPKGHRSTPPISLHSSIRDFDAIYTAPRSGFESREHYYASCSTVGLLDRIQTPTVLLTAKDDPFVQFDDYERAKLSPRVHLHAENHGGHMGYISDYPTPLGTRRWMDYAIDATVARFLA